MHSLFRHISSQVCDRIAYAGICDPKNGWNTRLAVLISHIVAYSFKITVNAIQDHLVPNSS
jgi:hypothetical protein